LNLPLGYRYAAAYAGIRKNAKDDVGLIVSDVPAQAAAVFTQNMVKAAPVRLAQANLKKSGGKVRAILVNAGNANCATRTGDEVAKLACKAAAKQLKTKAEWILPASTGVIGVELDPKLLTASLPKLVASLSPDTFAAVADAIMTTDTRPKVAFDELRLPGGVIRIAGMTKGAGMIHPNMATMLGFIMTDAAVPAAWLRTTLATATERSFNSLTVDGDMSTNDTLALLANGASKVSPDRKGREQLAESIARVAESLAKQIAADGEGARKLIVVETKGFKNGAEARKLAGSIANSPLVKTAIAGSDPNWGRIIAAAGYSGVIFNPPDVDIFLQDVPVCQNGLAADFDEAGLKTKLDRPEVNIRLVLRGRGKGEARVFTCDFTEGYIQINGSYRT
jgi:glutamate N-acetyltransferase / amino-acid N-acetyltransferase